MWLWIIVGIVIFIILIIIWKKINSNKENNESYTYKRKSGLRRLLEACCLHR